MNPEPTTQISTKVLLLLGLGLALLLAGFLSYYASSDPDGLEFVASQEGFLETATDHQAADSPLADYRTKGVASGQLAGAIAGITGTVVVLLLAGGLAWLVRNRNSRTSPDH
jgi:cobalt/nickel transport protein